MKTFKVEDLIGHIRQLPPSNVKVIPTFFNKCLDESSNGILSESAVRRIVQDWPVDCDTGKRDFLQKLGITYTINRCVTCNSSETLWKIVYRYGAGNKRDSIVACTQHVGQHLLFKPYGFSEVTQV